MKNKLRLLEEERTLPHALLKASATYGDRIAITDGERNVTFRELPGLAQQTAEILLGLGVNPGDRVMVIAENWKDTVRYGYIQQLNSEPLL